MNAKQLKALAADPAKFRDVLTIPAGRGPVRLGVAMAPYQRKDFAALDQGFAALANGQRPAPRRFWLERTKGGSKDSDLAIQLLWLLAFSPRPLVCQVGAGDADQADELRKAAKATLRLNPWLGEVLAIQSWRIVNTRTDSRCDIIAADVQGSHGARPDLLILNELSHVGKQEFAENLLDNASKVPHGVVVIATNAGFVPSWQFDWRESARTSGRWYFAALTEPAPWLDPAEIAEARKRNSPQRFARLWAGQWVRGSGDALPAADIEAAVTQEGPLCGDERATFYGGLDLGVSRDHSALVGLGLMPTNRIQLATVQSWAPPLGGLFGRKIDLAKVEEAVRQAHKQYRFHKVFFDPHQAELMAQNLQRAGVPMEAAPFTQANLALMATFLLERFHSRTLDLYPDKQLLTDLHQLKLIDRGTSFRLDAMRNSQGHGDRGTAFCLALFAAEKYPTVFWDGTLGSAKPEHRSPFAQPPRGTFGGGEFRSPPKW